MFWVLRSKVTYHDILWHASPRCQFWSSSDWIQHLWPSPWRWWRQRWKQQLGKRRRGFSERLSILGINFKRSRYGGVPLMCNQDMDGSQIRTAWPSLPRRIPPIAIYWWQVYPRECLAYTMEKTGCSKNAGFESIWLLEKKGVTWLL